MATDVKGTLPPKSGGENGDDTFPAQPSRWNAVTYFALALLILLVLLLILFFCLIFIKRKPKHHHDHHHHEQQQQQQQQQWQQPVQESGIAFEMNSTELAELGITSEFKRMDEDDFVDDNPAEPTKAFHDLELNTDTLPQLTDEKGEPSRVRLRAIQRTHALHRREIEHTNGTSVNWSGYATPSTTNSVTQIIGNWIAPKLSSAPGNRWCSIWPGIDGYNNGTVEQLGTEHDWNGGKQDDYVWFEMFPASAFELVGFPVKAGDSMTASVTYVSGTQFRLVIQNNTRKVYYVVPAAYTKTSKALRSSAEMIVEAPSMGGVLPLSNFGTVNITGCSMTVRGRTGTFKNASWQSQAMNMVTPKPVTTKALTSALSPDGSAFSVVWRHE